MEENFDALEVIARTRGKVDLDTTPTGDGLFVLWGTLTAVFFLLEFVLWQVFQAGWCLWLWPGIPLIGGPWMAILLKKNHDITHMRTHESKLVLDYWIFMACTTGVGGFLFGFFDLYWLVENPMICLLIGMGAFITGEATRFRPMIIGGLIGAAIGLGSFLLQGDLWVWQLPTIALVAIVSLVIPGLVYKKGF